MSIQVEGLTKIYGAQRAVDDINFTAPEGQITGFLGPNGAGKSTTMKIATGYIEANEGEVWINGHSAVHHSVKVKKIIGYLPEHNPLYPDMYVKEFLGFVANAHGLRGKKAKKRIEEIILLCGLSQEQQKKLGALSKGYRQRVGLAKALLPDPNVLILDEPTTGLDPNQIVEIRNVIRKISSEKTVILSTHIMQEVEALCDKVVIINKGRIVADDTLSNLKEQSTETKKIEVVFDDTVSSDVFQELPGLTGIFHEGKKLILESNSKSLRSDIMKVISKKELPLSSMKNVGGSLEEIFAQLTQERKEENE